MSAGVVYRRGQQDGECGKCFPDGVIGIHHRFSVDECLRPALLALFAMPIVRRFADPLSPVAGFAAKVAR